MPRNYFDNPLLKSATYRGLLMLAFSAGGVATATFAKNMHNSPLVTTALLYVGFAASVLGVSAAINYGRIALREARQMNLVRAQEARAPARVEEELRVPNPIFDREQQQDGLQNPAAAQLEGVQQRQQ